LPHIVHWNVGGVIQGLVFEERGESSKFCCAVCAVDGAALLQAVVLPGNASAEGTGQDECSVGLEWHREHSNVLLCFCLWVACDAQRACDCGLLERGIMYPSLS